MAHPLETALRQQGIETHFDAMHRQIYSVDASIYEVEPLGIALPKSQSELVTVVQLARKFDVPLTARGAATGITGSCLGAGLIIDTSKYLNRILEVNYLHEYARCEPGVVQDQLNARLSEHGYRLGPDTSTGNRATIGGMVGNHAAGARSLLYGTMADHVQAVELILSTGELITLTSLDEKAWEQKRAQQNREGEIYRALYRIQQTYREEIRDHFPRLPRRASGYNLDAFIRPGPFNPCRLIVGSEGTLGIVSQVQVKISQKPKTTGLCLLYFDQMVDAFQAVTTILKYSPISLELIDDKILDAGRRAPSLKGKLGWLIGKPHAILVAEFQENTSAELTQTLVRFSTAMREQGIGHHHTSFTDPAQMAAVWEVRKSGLGLLLSKRSYSRAIAFIEDFSVPPEKLAPFMERFCKYLGTIGKDAGIYGHVGSGCMHVRPYVNLHQEQPLMKKIMEDVSSMLLEYGGVMSGEHGDGLVRSWLNRKMFGDRLYQAFVDIKAAFDPEDRMNPGKIVHAQPFLENLRAAPKTQIETFLDFSGEGGFELAADLCNGNGFCRKSEKVMCPSFQATGDEYDTTRARAQALRSVIDGRLPVHDLASQAVHDVLDLCLECKGCKRECPSEVDMAKMKSEVLYHYQKAHGTSLRTRLFAHIGQLTAYAAPLATFYNQVGQTRFAKWMLSCLGVAPERELPAIATLRFSKWFKQNPSPEHRQRVVLYNDTFTEFHHPEVGQAAVKVLQGLGYEVIVPPWTCCGRPALSKGCLEQAQTMARAVVDRLAPYAEEGLPIIGLEPSCLLTIVDDYDALLRDHPDLERVMRACVTFDQFLHRNLSRFPLLDFNEKARTVKLHGHCHQKAVIGTETALNVLRAVPGYTVTEIPSGCCGMAGSFGYEKEHYVLSMQIGELKLFPSIRSSQEETLFVADGFSCRCQIAHGTEREAVHLAQAVADAIIS